MEAKFYVVNKKQGYAVKTLNNESDARTLAEKCCKANHNTNYIVCIYKGYFQEI